MINVNPTTPESSEHERRTTVREMEVEQYLHGNPWAPGHDFKLVFPVGHNTCNTVTLNAAELRRWAAILAEHAVRLAPEPTPPGEEPSAPTCPGCRGDVHVDLAGEIWSTTAAEAERARALHRPVEYRPGDHYANYAPPRRVPRRVQVRVQVRVTEERPEVVTVCGECQAQADDLLGRESGGFGSYEVVEYPCRTIRAMDGEAAS